MSYGRCLNCDYCKINTWTLDNFSPQRVCLLKRTSGNLYNNGCNEFKPRVSKLKVVCSVCGEVVDKKDAYFEDDKIFCTKCRPWQKWFSKKELEEFKNMEFDQDDKYYTSQ